jgi:hypothetical protein
MDFEVISQEMLEKIAAVEGGLQEETTYDGRKLRWTEEARKGLWTMKNAYQRRRTKARVEKRARMKKLDAITLDFARQVIEEETGAPLEIPSRPGSFAPPASAEAAADAPARPREDGPAGRPDGVKLIARDEKNNPLISTFDWTGDAVQRIFRVPAGFMRTKTQERIEELAREREASGEGRAAIDLATVEAGIEIGKRMMAEMIGSYSGPTPTGPKPAVAETPARAENDGSEYLNEVSALTSNSQLPISNSQVHNGNSQLPNANSQTPVPGKPLGSWKLEIGS